MKSGKEEINNNNNNFATTLNEKMTNTNLIAFLNALSEDYKHKHKSLKEALRGFFKHHADPLKMLKEWTKTKKFNFQPDNKPHPPHTPISFADFTRQLSDHNYKEFKKYLSQQVTITRHLIRPSKPLKRYANYFNQSLGKSFEVGYISRLPL